MRSTLISTQEAGRRLGVRPATVRRMVKDGRLAGVKAGSRIRITTTSLEAFIERHRIASGGPSRERDPVVGLLRAVLGELREIRRRLNGEAG